MLRYELWLTDWVIDWRLKKYGSWTSSSGEQFIQSGGEMGGEVILSKRSDQTWIDTKNWYLTKLDGEEIQEVKKEQEKMMDNCRVFVL